MSEPNAAPSINPNAREYFESQAQSLLQRFRPFAEHPHPRSWEPDRVPVLAIGPAELSGPITRERINPKTLRIDQIVIASATAGFALDGDACDELDVLAEKIALDQGMRRFTNAKAVRDRLMQWLIRSCRESG